MVGHLAWDSDSIPILPLWAISPAGTKLLKERNFCTELSCWEIYGKFNKVKLICCSDLFVTAGKINQLLKFFHCYFYGDNFTEICIFGTCRNFAIRLKIYGKPGLLTYFLRSQTPQFAGRYHLFQVLVPPVFLWHFLSSSL